MRDLQLLHSPGQLALGPVRWVGLDLPEAVGEVDCLLVGGPGP